MNPMILKRRDLRPMIKEMLLTELPEVNEREWTLFRRRELRSERKLQLPLWRNMHKYVDMEEVLRLKAEQKEQQQRKAPITLSSPPNSDNDEFGEDDNGNDNIL